MTDVFKLNVGENVTVSRNKYELAEVMADATDVVKFYQSDLFYDAFEIADALRVAKDSVWGFHPTYVWALRETGTDFVTTQTWASFDQYVERARIAFVLTFGEYGVNFERIK